MTLHIFNPEHDIALASNLANFTAPHAGRQLRGDLGFLPALWAAEGDAVLVECAPLARQRYARLQRRLQAPQVRFVERGDLPQLAFDAVQPWGWDRALRAQLLRWGVSGVPAEGVVDVHRQLSHRRTSSLLLPQLLMEGTVGESCECSTVDEVLQVAAQWQRVVLKAPWSSSGRGVRFVADPSLLTTDAHLSGWLRNLLQQQVNVMVEPLYNKVKDFALEFWAEASGRIHYEGLSLFHTVNGAYTGNVVATEDAKRHQLSRYVSLALLDRVTERIVSTLRLPGYEGPFGIDMMVVDVQGSTLLHPCVEINLRRTMGHVALALQRLLITDGDPDRRYTMLVDYDGNNYKLKIHRL